MAAPSLDCTSDSPVTWAMEIAHFDPENPGFELLSRANGVTTWSAREIGQILGYASYESFRKGPITKAQQVLLSLQIDIGEHFRTETITDESGVQKQDIRLSRFACYLAAMNGDPKKVQIAEAQAYFATFADACRRYIEESDDFERIIIRDEISDHEKGLSSTAKNSGVDNYAFFQNAGYRGLYNMNLKKLKTLKGVPKSRSPLDFMGKAELAANLFRITQTEQKIKNQGIRGQTNLEKAAESVGREVRETMRKVSGDLPEDLAPAEDIKKLKTGIKQTGAGLQSVDKKK